MRIYLYKGFSKRENSTKRPSSSVDHKSVEVYLKDGTSILNPTFELAMTGVFDGEWSSIDDYNYARVDNWGRYYWITDVVYTNSTVEIVCKVDTLASWRNYIGSSTQYVLRSSNENAYDGNVQDGLYPTKSATSKEQSTVDTNFNKKLTQGFYILGYVDKLSSGLPDNGTGCRYVVLTASEFNELAHLIASYEINSLGLLEPVSYIISIKWFPFKPETTNLNRRIELGALSYTPEKFRLITEPVYESLNFSFSGANGIPKHPQADDRGRYLNTAPYSRYTFYNPLCGEFPIDPQLIVAHDTLKFSFKCDCVTGDSNIRLFVVHNGTDYTIGTIRCSMGVDIAIGQETMKLLETGADIVKSGVSVASGNYVGAATGILSAASNAIPQVQTKGINGSFLPYTYKFTLRAEFNLLVDEDIADRGRPTMKKLQLSSYPGYLVCADADIALPSTQSENIEVKGYLTSGFFFE